MAFEMPKRIHSYKNLIIRIYDQNHQNDYVNILRPSEWQVREGVSYDDYWDNHGHQLVIHIPEEIYLKAFDDKEEIEENLLKKLREAIPSFENESLNSVVLDLMSDEDSGHIDIGNNIPFNDVTDADILRIWEHPDRLRVFLSHRAAHKKLAHILKEKTRDRGISAFVAHDDIKADAPWELEIKRALRTMDVLVALMTPDFHNDSDWTDQEIGFAIGRQVPVIPINLGLNPYGFIGSIQSPPFKWINDFDSARNIHQRMFEHEDINLKAKARRKLIDSLISASYYRMADLITKIIHKEGWILDTSELQKLERALTENSNVSENDDICNRISEIFNRQGHHFKQKNEAIEEDEDLPF
ncbi:MAG TPA: toll/interleukin-1 receptor domain-containing protein [Bacteroidetes bacterium]|nr:hypothetical protein BMS3Bbin04_00608 [bacterium BMS3Bbin04]HDO65769.1 toll/interleukin-1 receptor domain-containing protein [Bacteroidota bacterium]HEX04894.1 toll/interleukin-1 receptor domain-containing protein [Bacteroidota bacterium]